MRSLFKFKQFNIYQLENVAKVGTDSVLLGSSLILDVSCKRILDIGTGTGVISLMIAQRYKSASIYGIDIDSTTVQLCEENFIKSLWLDRLKAIEADIIDYNPYERFDHIVCNPPFFSSGILPKSESRQRIRHTINLSFEQLFKSVDRLLKPKGNFSLIIPDSIGKKILRIAADFSLYPFKITYFRDQKKKARIRQIISFSRIRLVQVNEEDIYIYEKDRTFSKKLTELLFDYLIIFKT